MQSNSTYDKYTKTDLTDVLRGKLSGVIYGWSALYPEPMTSFADVCTTQSKENTDILIRYLEKAIADSNNIHDISSALQNAVDQTANNTFNIEACKAEFERVSNQSKNLDSINSVLQIKKWVDNLFQGRFDLKNLHDDDALNKVTTKELKEAVIGLRTVDDKLIKVIYAEVDIIRTQATQVQAKLMMSNRLDEIIRDSSNYNDPTKTSELLKEKFDNANKDIGLVNELAKKYDDAREQAKNAGDTSAVKLYGKYLTKYPLEKNLTGIISGLEQDIKDRQQYFAGLDLVVTPKEPYNSYDNARKAVENAYNNLINKETFLGLTQYKQKIILQDMFAKLEELNQNNTNHKDQKYIINAIDNCKKLNMNTAIKNNKRSEIILAIKPDLKAIVDRINNLINHYEQKGKQQVVTNLNNMLDNLQNTVVKNMPVDMQKISNDLKKISQEYTKSERSNVLTRFFHNSTISKEAKQMEKELPELSSPKKRM